MTQINGSASTVVKKFFRGRRESLQLFTLLVKTIEKICSPELEVSKTQISFGELYKYIWVWLPQTWIKKRAENPITLTIVTGKKIKSNRIEESVQPKKGYWTHHILINESKDIDREVERLVKESYHFYLDRLKKRHTKTAQKVNKKHVS